MKTKILLISLLAFLLPGCDEKDILEFSTDDTAVFFQGSDGYSYAADGSVIYAKTYYYKDSTVFSFAGVNKRYVSNILSVPVRTMGKVSDFRRPVKIVVDKEETNAIEGVDYEVDLDTVAIPARSSETTLQVKVLRTDALLEQTKRLVFHIEENEFFKLNIRTMNACSDWKTGSDTLNVLKYKFIFNERYTEPRFYAQYADDYWGPWSPKKFQTLNDVMGWTMSDWRYAGYYGFKIVAGRVGFATRALQKHLQEMADAGTPVREADGSLMQLSHKYLVDYSKYE